MTTTTTTSELVPAATIARWFDTIASFYKYAVIDGVIPANP